VPVNARTCKHLKSLFGEKYEIARLKFKNPNGPPPKGSSSSKKAVSKSKTKATQSKPASKRKKDDDGDAAGDEEDGKPSKKPRSKPPSSKGRTKDDEDENDEDGDGDEEEAAASGKTVPELLLANKWDIESGLDPAGWWISEKLDGVRCAHLFTGRTAKSSSPSRTYYDGKQMISRLGNPFTPPQWFLESAFMFYVLRTSALYSDGMLELPKDVTLDGELFGGRGEFQSTVSIVKTINSPHWKNITFQVLHVFLSKEGFLQESLLPRYLTSLQEAKSHLKTALSS